MDPNEACWDYRRANEVAFADHHGLPRPNAIASWLDWKTKGALSAAACRLFDHRWVDGDIGNPEVGSAPYIFCQRCGTPAEEC